MCNLNLFIKCDKTGKKETAEILSVMDCSTAFSFINNSHGEGVYFSEDDELITSEEKINLMDFRNEVRQSNFILSHQRIATSGFNGEFTQPFKNKNFVFAHNGIFSDFENVKKSDSFVFFERFNKMFSKLKGNREKNIIKTIKKLLDKETGSYSIFILDKKTQILYYFKNNRTSITLTRNKNKDRMFITTEEDNIRFLEIYFNDFREINIKDNCIYKIFIDNKQIKIKPIDKIKKNSLNYDGGLRDWYGRGYEDIVSEDLNEDLKKDKPLSLFYDFEDFKNELKEIKMFDDMGECSRCKMTKTYMFSKTENGFLCGNCLKEEYEQTKRYEDYI